MKPSGGTIEVRLDMATKMSISAKEPKLTLETHTISVCTPSTPSLNQALTSTLGPDSPPDSLLYAKGAFKKLFIDKTPQKGPEADDSSSTNPLKTDIQVTDDIVKFLTTRDERCQSITAELRRRTNKLR